MQTDYDKLFRMLRSPTLPPPMPEQVLSPLDIPPLVPSDNWVPVTADKAGPACMTAVYMEYPDSVRIYYHADGTKHYRQHTDGTRYYFEQEG